MPGGGERDSTPDGTPDAAVALPQAARVQLGAKPASPWVVWDGLTEQRSDAPPGGASIGRARAGGGTLEACNGTQVTFGWESRGSDHTTASASPKPCLGSCSAHS